MFLLLQMTVKTTPCLNWTAANPTHVRRFNGWNLAHDGGNPPEIKSVEVPALVESLRATVQSDLTSPLKLSLDCLQRTGGLKTQEWLWKIMTCNNCINFHDSWFRCHYKLVKCNQLPRHSYVPCSSEIYHPNTKYTWTEIMRTLAHIKNLDILLMRQFHLCQDGPKTDAPTYLIDHP